MRRCTTWVVDIDLKEVNRTELAQAAALPRLTIQAPTNAYSRATSLLPQGGFKTIVHTIHGIQRTSRHNNRAEMITKK